MSGNEMAIVRYQVSVRNLGQGHKADAFLFVRWKDNFLWLCVTPAGHTPKSMSYLILANTEPTIFLKCINTIQTIKNDFLHLIL